MRAITCPKCGAPLKVEDRSCPYCRVGLTGDGGGFAEAEQAVRAESARKEFDLPAGWVWFEDGWHGFRVAHPAGWRVFTSKGQVSVREDVCGLSSAIIRPYRTQMPVMAQELANTFIRYARLISPGLQAWQQGNTAGDSRRITLRTKRQRFGQVVEGLYNILADGVNVIISGFEGPSSLISQRSEIYSQIISSFQTVGMFPRQQMQDPTEGSFSLDIPQGWVFGGGVDRNNIGGSGMMKFNAGRDQQGSVMVGMPWFRWNYMAGGFGFFGGYPGMQSANFVYADQYCRQSIVPWLNQNYREMRVDAITLRPDLNEQAVIELAQAGYPPEMFENSFALIDFTYAENNTRMRHSCRVGTQRQVVGATGPMWMAFLDVFWRAPEAEFAQWEPTLLGILDSMQVNPAWQQRESQHAANFIANSQMDTQRRLRQISQTLSETSDIINRGYWGRQQVYDRISEQRSDAIRGVQKMTTDGGEMYKVPVGFDRYWVDGLGNLYGGSWLSEPDINWKPLNMGVGVEQG